MPHGIYRIINTDKNDLFALCGGFRVLYICLYSHGFFYFHIDDLNVLYSTEFLNTYMFIPWIFIYVYVYSSPIFTYVYTHISHPFFTYIFVYFITHMCVFSSHYILTARVSATASKTACNHRTAVRFNTLKIFD